MVTDATNLHRLMNCNGSRLMAIIVPPETNQAAKDEGNAADWLAVKMFDGVPVNEGSRAPNGHVITSDMIEHITGYVGSLDCGEMQAVTSFGTERWQVNARCDHRKWIDGVSLRITDLKYGHRIIEPFENWALIAHAVGTCIDLQIAPNKIELEIYQPRPYHPDGKSRVWHLSYSDLMGYYNQIDATLSNPSDMLQTGSHCTNCGAAPTCPAHRMSGYNAVEASTLAFNDDLPVDAIEHELDLMLAAQKRIDGRVDALTELASHRIKSGHAFQRYSVEPRRANTRFKPGYTAAMLTALTKINCATEPGIITPAEFKRRGASQVVYDALTERPLIGSKLVRVDADTRARRALNKE